MCVLFVCVRKVKTCSQPVLKRNPYNTNYTMLNQTARTFAPALSCVRPGLSLCVTAAAPFRLFEDLLFRLLFDSHPPSRSALPRSPVVQHLSW